MDKSKNISDVNSPGDLDRDSQKKKGRSRNKELTQQDALAEVSVRGYWWMVGFFIVFTAFIFAVFGWVKAIEDRAEDVKTAIVKLAPDGSSFVEFHNEDAPVDVWPSVINSLLEKAFTRRYKTDPRTVANDLTYFSYFLDKQQYNIFLNEFDAVGYVEQVEADTKSPMVIPVLRSMNHMDAEEINVNALTGNELVTTNLYFDFELRNRKTGLLVRPDIPAEEKIVVVKWRINPMKLKRSSYDNELMFRASLFENPIGIDILDYSISDVSEGAQ